MVSVIYCSPRQNNSEFDLFLSNFEKLLSNINERKGSKLFSLTSSNGFSQLINEPTHIQTGSSSCTDLIFNNQPNLSVNSGVHASLHPNCHHQIIHSSLNLNISYPHHIKDLYGIIKRLIQKIFKKPLIQ